MLNIEKIKKYNQKKIWYFRFKKFDNSKYLVTNDIWRYIFLNENDFWKFIAWEIKVWELYEELDNKWFLINDSYKNTSAIAYANKNHFLAFWPVLHIVVLTLRCNHKCKYCHASAWNENSENLDMSLDIASKTLDTILHTSSNKISIEFQWGEPLLNWEVLKYFVEQWRYKAHLLKKSINFALVSNLTLMDDDKLKFLIENWVWISTSLDWDESLHNSNRLWTNWNSFEVVSKWIKKINDEYSVKWLKDLNGNTMSVWVLLTITKKSLSKYKEIIDTYIKLWITWIFLRILNPYWFADVWKENLWYTHSEFIEFYKKCLDYIIELNIQWIKIRELFTSIYLTKILAPRDPNFLDERSPCWACIWQLAYNYDWKIYTCDEWRMLWRMGINDFEVITIGNEAKENYRKIFDSELTKSMVQASTLDWLPWYNDDVYKPYIWVCPIFNFKQSWNIYPNYSIDTRRKVSVSILDYIFEKLQDEKSKNIFENWLWTKNSDIKCI